MQSLFYMQFIKEFSDIEVNTLLVGGFVKQYTFFINAKAKLISTVVSWIIFR